MKLFIWKNVLNDYTKGVAFVLARNVAQARRLLLKQNPNLESWIQRPPDVATSAPYAFSVHGGG